MEDSLTQLQTKWVVYFGGELSRYLILERRVGFTLFALFSFEAGGHATDGDGLWALLSGVMSTSSANSTGAWLSLELSNTINVSTMGFSSQIGGKVPCWDFPSGLPTIEFPLSELVCNPGDEAVWLGWPLITISSDTAGRGWWSTIDNAWKSRPGVGEHAERSAKSKPGVGEWIDRGVKTLKAGESAKVPCQHVSGGYESLSYRWPGWPLTAAALPKSPFWTRNAQYCDLPRAFYWLERSFSCFQACVWPWSGQVAPWSQFLRSWYLSPISGAYSWVASHCSWIRHCSQKWGNEIPLLWIHVLRWEPGWPLGAVCPLKCKAAWYWSFALPILHRSIGEPWYYFSWVLKLLLNSFL